MRTALYRHFDSQRRLLYVGVSLHAVIRLAAHRANACWFDRVSFVKVQWFDTRVAALKAEDAAIRKERPLFNNGGRPAGEPLTELFVRRVKKPGYYYDGDGLVLHVGNGRPHPYKSWLYRFSWHRKRTSFRLGDHSFMSLAVARKRASECRDIVASGRHPGHERKLASAATAEKYRREQEELQTWFRLSVQRGYLAGDSISRIERAVGRRGAIANLFRELEQAGYVRGSNAPRRRGRPRLPSTEQQRQSAEAP